MNEAPPPGESEILKVARTVTPELPGLLGSDAPAFGRMLSELAEQARSSQDPPARMHAEDEIYRLLASRDETRERMDQLLPEEQEERGWARVLGHSSPVPADRWICPEQGCTFNFPVLSIDDPTPPPEFCLVHEKVRLVFRPATAAH
ncbi:MAG: hypothetical protein ACRDRJ_19060 [Streptosporangiaceae bacterium]